MKKPRSILDRLLAYTYNGTLFVPKTETEQKMRTFVNLIAKNVYSK